MQTAISRAQIFSSLASDRVGIENTFGEGEKFEKHRLKEEMCPRYLGLADGLPEIRVRLQFPIELVRV